MAIVRVVKDKNFITMGKYHLKEKDMSLKAIGLLSIMLSLPDDWDYSIKGLVKIRKESYDAIRTTLKELEQFGYLKRTQILDKGKFVDVEYTIYEKPILENPITEKPILENHTQLNTNIIKDLNNKEENINNKLFIQKKFKKPTLEEVRDYCLERNNDIDPETFIDFYESKGWQIGKSKMTDWKAAIRTWEHKNKPKQTKSKNQLFFEEMMRKAEEEERDEQKRSNNLNEQD